MKATNDFFKKNLIIKNKKTMYFVTIFNNQCKTKTSNIFLFYLRLSII